MSSSKASKPSALNISREAFQYLLKLYPSVVDTVYRAKHQDNKKYNAAIDDNKFRWVGLPTKLARLPGDQGLTFQDLERLVRWKITHGKYRPFLPGQVKKNEPSAVESITARSRQTLFKYREAGSSSTPSTEILSESLNQVCELKGVGPATGTLVLSLCDEKNVPFFQDELYTWLVGDEKLKYNVKEYSALFAEVGKLRKRLATTAGHSSASSATPTAQEVEKVGYVVGHWDMLDNDEKAKIALLGKPNHQKSPVRPSKTDEFKKKNQKELNGPLNNLPREEADRGLRNQEERTRAKRSLTGQSKSENPRPLEELYVEEENPNKKRKVLSKTKKG